MMGSTIDKYFVSQYEHGIRKPTEWGWVGMGKRESKSGDNLILLQQNLYVMSLIPIFVLNWIFYKLIKFVYPSNHNQYKWFEWNVCTFHSVQLHFVLCKSNPRILHPGGSLTTILLLKTEWQDLQSLLEEWSHCNVIP